MSIEKIPRRRLGRYLRIKKEYVDLILSGKKRSTIRLGIVSPTKHKVFIESEGKVVGEALIDSVRYSKLSELNDRDAKIDGFSNINELIKELSNIYPGIRKDDWVTIIKFKLINSRGKHYNREVSSNRGDMEESLAIMNVAKLALAYDVTETSLEKRILTAIALKGSLEGVDKEIGGDITPSLVKTVYLKAFKKLKQLGVLK